MILIQASPELQIYIRKTFNEDVNTRNHDLEAIKEWLRKQPHLPDTWDEQRLMTFLRGCNFSLERCKRKLDMYFTMRTAIPEFFTNRDINLPEMREIVKFSKAAVLPGLTPSGKRVIVAGAARTDFGHLNFANFLKLALMVGDIRLEIETFGVVGDVYIFDASVALSMHLLKVSPTLVRKFFICVQEAYPVKIKEVHVVHTTPLVEFIINSVKPLMKEKLRNRIHVHGHLESLHRFVPKDILPEEYGGTAGKLEQFQEQWLKKLEEYTEWFKEQESVKADESKRPGKPTNYDNLFGLEGSFRKLAVD